MPDRRVVLCPGQGAQTVEMGKAWHDHADASRAVFEQADTALANIWADLASDLADTPLSALCFEGPADTLNRTDACQPAIFVASVASWHGLCEAEGVDPRAASLEAAAGLSLGEYTALHIAGAIAFEPALRLVALRGRAMQDAADAEPSSMVALIGADAANANELCDRARAAGEVLVPANFNAPGQVVVSGSAAACDRAEAVAGEVGLRATRIQVAGAFHSPLMRPAADRLAEALAQTEIAMPRASVISNVTAEPHRSPDEIRRGLFDQLTSPVRWAQSCEWLVTEMQGGASFHELAPGRSLAGMMRRISRDTKVITHDAPA